MEIELQPMVSRFVKAVINGTAPELACFGTRGDGKTIGALLSMICHAKKHQEMGYPLPVIWMGVTDTHQSHKEKTIPSMNNALWQGMWTQREQDHMAVATIGGVEAVHMSLFGIEDQSAMNRVRRESCGVWFEEPAPAGYASSGVNEVSWLTAITSLRIPSYYNPAIMTLNYPAASHWTWKRFFGSKRQDIEPVKGAKAFRVPPGELASDADRQRWIDATEGRPDLQQRLLTGEPASVYMGPPVAHNFRPDIHVENGEMAAHPHEPLHLGWDGGHTPVCVIGQEWRGRMQILASLSEQRAGTKQLAENKVKPWLVNHARWALDDWQMLRHCYDPALNTDEQADIDMNPVEIINEILGGAMEPGPVPWIGREELLIANLGRINGIVIAAEGDGNDDLIEALKGQWHYPEDRLGNVSKDKPKKPNHPWEDFGDALIYMLAGMRPGAAKSTKPLKVETYFDAFHDPSEDQVRVETEFDSLRG